jgi:uncharacterized protein
MIFSVLRILLLLLIVYLILCGIIYFYQEKLIFFPEKLDKDYRFRFSSEFEEIFVDVQGGSKIHGILFKAENSKGLIFYLHGNAGSLRSWGAEAETYTLLGFDVFMIDYRGYGKSGGKIESENRLFSDMQSAYDEIKKRYDEDRIIILGYSIGSGPAAYLASENSPEKLILQAPFYNLTDMMKRYFPIFPSFLLKYKMENDRHLKEAKMPVIIFHGDEDEVIYYGSSVKLSKHFKDGDRLITLKGQTHNGMGDHPDYQREMRSILIPDMHTSMNSLDWDGTYRGVLPCADCESIETVIILNNDMTYKLERKYTGKSGEVFRSEGKFEWSSDGRIVILQNETPGKYQVGENALFQLGADGKRITGDLADMYILRKMGE